jgi:glycosyltransferase involved in cell wall biosynthesis
MKVLQVVPGMSPKYGGPSVALTNMTRLLSKHDIETTLITTNVDPAGRLNVPLGMPIEQCGARMLYYNVWPLGRYAFSPSLAKALFQTAHLYDIIHIHWLYNFSSLLAAIAARKSQVPYVFQPNGSLDPNLMRRNRAVKRSYIALFGNYILRHADAIIFTSEAERRLAGLNGMPALSYVVPVGLDWAEYTNLPPLGEFRKQFPEIGNRQVVLFLGRISRQKGLDILISAFRKVVLEQPTAHLIIAGPDGEGYSREVKKLVAEFDLKSCVTFVGPLQGRSKLAAYVDSDVFVLPSYGENFGATVAEALACKCPVVISDRVNICDEITSAEAGIVTECSVDSTADGISRILGDQNLARRLGENGYELVKQNFTWDVAMKKLIPIYREISGKEY